MRLTFTRNKRKGLKILAALVITAFSSVLLYSQVIPEPDLAGLRAEEEFRTGIHAYNRYAYNEAIRAFETALLNRPGEALILDWLGRAYYRSGFEETACEQWESAAQAYGEGRDEALLALSRVETIRARRSQLSAMSDTGRFVEGGRFEGKQGNVSVFRQPSAILPCADGSVWVAAYTSNELLRIDPNGVTRERNRGPLSGFDRPYDIARGRDGRLFVSEFRGGRVSALSPEGQWQSYLGAKGRAPGELIGPSSLTVDDEGYVYVVEYGNRRISKFSPDGEFIHNFGQRDGFFDGFMSPTGIAYAGGRIFAADNLKKTIYTFDTDGIYLGIFIEDGLEAPESLRVWDENTLLISDSRRILLVDINSAIIREIGSAGNRNVRVIDANFDKNGNILTANFDKNEITIMQGIDELAAGLFVQIDRVFAENFPQVTIEVSVTDRKGRPITGLSDINFLLSEGQGGQLAQVNGQTLLGSLDNPTVSTGIVLLTERSLETRALKDELAAAFRDIYNAARISGVNIAGIVSAGANPERERFTPDAAASYTTAARGRDETYTQNWHFDTGLRLAASDLLPLSRKRAVVFVTSGQMGGEAFGQYTISELAAFLKTAGIGFYAVVVGQEPAGDEVEFLARATGGGVARLYSPEGLESFIGGIKERVSGSYLLRYTSKLPSNFGRAFLPVEAEVYLLERSGRDRVGYFAPLE